MTSYPLLEAGAVPVALNFLETDWVLCAVGNQLRRVPLSALWTQSEVVPHTHTIANILLLQDALNGKQPAGSYAAASHVHPASQVTGLQTLLDGKQPLDVDLTAIAALVSAADRLPYATGAGTWGLATFTPFGRSLMDDADAATARATLGAAAIAHTHTIAQTTGLQGALDALDTFASPFATVGGSANTLTLTTGAALASIVRGQRVRFRAAAPNTGATTLNVDGRGAQPAATVTGATLPEGYLRTDVDTVAMWDGATWIVDRQREHVENANGEAWLNADGSFMAARTVPAQARGSASSAGGLFRSPVGDFPLPIPFITARGSAGAPAGFDSGFLVQGGVGPTGWQVQWARIQDFSGIVVPTVQLHAVGTWY